MFSRTERLTKAYEAKTYIHRNLIIAKEYRRGYKKEAQLNAFFTILAALVAMVSIPATYGAFGEDGLLLGGIFTALFGVLAFINSFNWEESNDNRKFWEDEIKRQAKELREIKAAIDHIERTPGNPPLQMAGNRFI